MMNGLIALILSLILTPYVAQINAKAGIVGKDIHKRDRPEIPEMGGIAIVIAVLFSSALVHIDSTPLVVFSLFALLGVLDDLTKMKQLHKVLLSILFALPLVTLRGDSISVFGHWVYLGFLYEIFVILFVTASANLVNMLAGFNGLEVGTGAIALGALSLVTKGTARELSIIGVGASVGFLVWNRYPSKVFPGDVGTLSLGALIGLIAIIGHAESAAAILLLPHFLDFLLKAIDVRFGVRKKGGAKIREDGRLLPPNYRSLLGILIKTIKPKEWELVLIVWLIEAILAGIVVFIE